jgi:hypothetical protein
VSVKTPELIKRRVYDEFISAGITASGVSAFCEQKAAEIGVSIGTVRNWIATIREQEDMTVKAAAYTKYQKLASMVGASAVEALRTLQSNLKAQTKKVIVTKDGTIVDTVTNPDYAARNAAAIAILKVHGGFAPDRIETTVRDERDPSNMSEGDIDAEIRRLEAQALGANAREAGSPGTD